MVMRSVDTAGSQRQLGGHLYVVLTPDCRMLRILHLRLSVTRKEPMTIQKLYSAINNVVT